MRICGVDYRSNDLIPVVIEPVEGGWRVVDTRPRKLTLNDLFDTADVRLFAKSVESFLRDAAVDVVVIKKRARSGKFGGGAASFRMGGILQLSTEKPVEFISAQAITTALTGVQHVDADKLPQYQRGAFNVALAYALRKQADR